MGFLFGSGIPFPCDLHARRRRCTSDRLTGPSLYGHLQSVVGLDGNGHPIQYSAVVLPPEGPPALKYRQIPLLCTSACWRPAQRCIVLLLIVPNEGECRSSSSVRLPCLVAIRYARHQVPACKGTRHHQAVGLRQLTCEVGRHACQTRRGTRGLWVQMHMKSGAEDVGIPPVPCTHSPRKSAVGRCGSRWASPGPI